MGKGRSGEAGERVAMNKGEHRREMGVVGERARPGREVAEMTVIWRGKHVDDKDASIVRLELGLPKAAV